MTCCHYVIFRTYCDILLEFSCNFHYSGVQKDEKLKFCQTKSRHAKIQPCRDFWDTFAYVPVWGKSRRANYNCAARFWLGQAQNIYKYCTQPEEKELRFWRAKCDFETSETARRAVSSTFYQFMYVLIISLIMLFVNSIMSS
jgi:hypothetical protein